MVRQYGNRQIWLSWSFVFSLLFAVPVFAQPVAAPAAPTPAIQVEDLATPAPHRPITAVASRALRQTVPLSSPQMIPKLPRMASLSFSWNMPVSLAVFKRDEKLWVVFDRPMNLNLDELKKSAEGLATDIIQFPHPGATIIQMRPLPGVRFSVRKEGLLWVVDLLTGDIPPRPVKDMEVFTQYDSLKRPYLFIPGENAGNLVLAIDPDVGDVITIAPNADLGLGFNRTYFYPEFAILNSVQGMAMVIKAPDIILNRGNTGLTLRAFDRGLNISDNLETMKRQQILRESGDTLAAFDLEISPQLLRMNFAEAVDQLKNDIIAADPNKKNTARLELVKYYLSKGLGTEALNILRQMEKAKTPETSSDKFHALLGVANFLTRRYAESVLNFEHGSLPAINEAVFWRTLSSSALEFKQEDDAVLFSFISLIKDYPPELKDRIALVAANTALLSGDDLAAQNFIDILRTQEERLIDRTPQVAYLSAKKLELQGYPRNAIRDYRRIADMNNAMYSALARYDATVLSQQLGLLPLKEAIAELEKLRYAWGETGFKWKLLNKLAELYVKNHDYYNGLRTLNENLALSTPAQKELLSNRMLGWFEDIYLNNQADTTLSAIKALALYQDFNWLALRSTQHDRIIQKLADRLVAVDLLPRASQLLEELLQDPRLPVEDRAKVGARLAIIHLFERDSTLALEVLNATESPGISEELQAHRRVIRSRTLANLGEIEKALNLLDCDYSKNSLLLQADIYWNGGQWAQASDTLKYLVEKPVKGKPLSNEQIGYILDWATALKKAGKETVLVRLRNKFMPWFKETKYHSAFNILTNRLEPDKIDLKQITNVVDDVQNYSNFAKVYNDSLKNLDLNK